MKCIIASLIVLATASAASAQGWGDVEIGGYGMYGRSTFTARNSFETILGESFGPIIGGGARVGLPWFNLFIDAGAWRLEETGERALVLNGQTYKLGIPETITVITFQLTAGYQFKQVHRWLPRLTPYVGGGYTSLQYKETSEFAGPGENVTLRKGGPHALGGVEVKVIKWLGVAGEFGWSSIDKAIGAGGISKEFGETDLGGTTLRAKITIGR